MKEKKKQDQDNRPVFSLQVSYYPMNEKDRVSILNKDIRATNLHSAKRSVMSALHKKGYFAKKIEVVT